MFTPQHCNPRSCAHQAQHQGQARFGLTAVLGIGGERNGNIKVVLLFEVEDKRLRGSRTGWGQKLPLSWACTSQPSLGFPLAVATAAARSSACAARHLLYKYHKANIKPSVWYTVGFPSEPAECNINLSIHKVKSSRRRMLLHLALPAAEKDVASWKSCSALYRLP